MLVFSEDFQNFLSAFRIYGDILDPEWEPVSDQHLSFFRPFWAVRLRSELMKGIIIVLVLVAFARLMTELRIYEALPVWIRHLPEPRDFRARSVTWGPDR